MEVLREMYLLHIILYFANNVSLLTSESGKLLVATQYIPTYTPGDLSVLEIRRVKSEIQCSLQCMDVRQCMAIVHNKAESECRLYGDAKHLADPLPQQTFRTIVCPDGWRAFDKSCYHINTVALTWHDALEACKVMGGYLVEIESAREDNFVTALILESTEVQNYYIGATDEDTDGEWIWASSGNQMIYNNWNPGDPNGQTTENYACKIFTWSAGMWNDWTGQSDLPSLCEMSRFTTSVLPN